MPFGPNSCFLQRFPIISLMHLTITKVSASGFPPKAREKISIFFLLFSQPLSSIQLQQTILLQNIVLAQAVYMINCRELSKPSLNQGLLQNKSLFLSLGILALLQGMVIFLPIGQQLIGTVSLTMTQQLLIGANVILLFLVVEIEKGIMNKLFRKKEKTAREYSR